MTETDPSAERRQQAAWESKLISGLGIVLAFAAPVAELLGVSPIAALDREPVRYAGLAVAVAGIISTLAA